MVVFIFTVYFNTPVDAYLHYHNSVGNCEHFKKNI